MAAPPTIKQLEGKARGIAQLAHGGRGQNSGLGFITLRDWDVRRGPENTVQALTARINAHFGSYQDALVEFLKTF